jgi:hypothetical protein
MHSVGLAIVVGIFAMRDLRLLGCYDGIRFESFDGLVKVAWVGFLINAISGVFLFTSQATTFVSSTPFLLKISMIFLAAILASVIQSKSRAVSDDLNQPGATAKGSLRALAGVSIALWVGAIISGRLIAYL